MAQVIQAGTDVFNAMVHGTPPESTVNFISQMQQNTSAILNDAGQRFIETAKNTFKPLFNDNAIRTAKALMRNVESLWQTNEIRPIREIGDFQVAPIAMQRWIMAEPTIRKLYHKQMCDGYSDTYVDVEPGAIGSDHYDYRRVMDGVVVEIDDEESEYDWKATTWVVDDIYNGDDVLNFDDKTIILDAWEDLRSHLRARQSDPTSRWDNDLS